MAGIGALFASVRLEDCPVRETVAERKLRGELVTPHFPLVRSEAIIRERMMTVEEKREQGYTRPASNWLTNFVAEQEEHKRARRRTASAIMWNTMVEKNTPRKLKIKRKARKVCAPILTGSIGALDK